jgi:hypothetical protein
MREKGFNPNVPKNILNRVNEDPKGNDNKLLLSLKSMTGEPPVKLKSVKTPKSG